MFRIGQGYDVHRLVEGRDLWICGIRLPHTHGLLGHSDAGVAIHALCGAILGAVALRDIGYHFPDTDPRYKGRQQASPCGSVQARARERVGNRQHRHHHNGGVPKFKPHIGAMREKLAEVMGISADCVSVKATTTEQLRIHRAQRGNCGYRSGLTL